MELSKSNYNKVVEAMKVLEKYPKEKQMYEDIKTEEFLQRVSENNFREEGIEEGERKKEKEIVKRMLKMNLKVSEIMKFTGLTEEEIEEIRKK